MAPRRIFLWRRKGCAGPNYVFVEAAERPRKAASARHRSLLSLVSRDYLLAPCVLCPDLVIGRVCDFADLRDVKPGAQTHVLSFGDFSLHELKKSYPLGQWPSGSFASYSKNKNQIVVSAANTGATCASRPSARATRARRSRICVESSAHNVACPTLRPVRGDLP